MRLEVDKYRTAAGAQQALGVWQNEFWWRRPPLVAGWSGESMIMINDGFGGVCWWHNQ